MGTSDSITILRSASGHLATKQFVRTEGRTSTIDYARGPLWRVATVSVDGIRTLGAELERLQDEQHCFVIRGQPKPGINLSKPVRRKVVGENATFDDVPRQWLHLDIDSVSAPHLDVITDPSGAAHYVLDVIKQHAPELDGVTCWASFSSSAGVRNETSAKLHVWFWLDREYSTAELKRWSAHVNARAEFKLIDPAVFGAVQPNYTARPVFTGMPDPLPVKRRFMLIDGHTEHATLAIAADQPRRPSAQRAGSDSGGSFAWGLAMIGGEGGLRQPALSALAARVAEIGADCAVLERDAMIAQVAGSLLAAPPGHRSRQTVDGYVSGLGSMFDWLLERQKQTEAARTMCPPRYSDSSLSLADAEVKLDEVMSEFFNQARAHTPIRLEQERKAAVARAKAKQKGHAPPTAYPPTAPVHAIRIDVGGGKTHAVIENIAKEKKRGGAEMLRYGYLVDRHKSGAQIENDFSAAGVIAQSWRGIGAFDPARPGSKMCTQLPLAHAAIAAGELSVGCGVCPARDTCAYLAQKHRPKAEVVIAAHNYLFSDSPSRLASVDVLIVDEKFYPQAIRDNAELLLSTLQGSVAALPTLLAADLTTIRGKLHRVLIRAIAEGELRRSMVSDECLTEPDCAQAFRLEWQRKPKVKLAEGLSLDQAIKALNQQADRFTPTSPALWRAMQHFIESGHEMSALIEPVGNLSVGRSGSGPGVRFSWLAPLAACWVNKPIFLMDATMPLGIARLLIPRVEIAANIEIARPHVYVEQLTDPLPTSALVGKDRRAKRKLSEAADRIEILACQYRDDGDGPFDVLVVSTKAVEEALRAELIGRNGVERVALRHHGDLAGENSYGGVRVVVLLGWALPPAGALERAATVLGGQAPKVTVGDDRWPMATAGIRMRDGSGYAVEVPHHPDELVEAVRWQTTEALMVQGVGRAREVRRTADRPVDVLIWSPLPLPGLAVDHLVRWDDVSPSRLELALWRLSGVLPLRPDDLVRTGLWDTAKAAARTLESVGLRPPVSFRDSPLKGTGGLKRFRYRKTGQRAWSTAWALAALPLSKVAVLLRAATGVDDLKVELYADAVVGVTAEGRPKAAPRLSRREPVSLAAAAPSPQIAAVLAAGRAAVASGADEFRFLDSAGRLATVDLPAQWDTAKWDTAVWA